MIEFDHLFKPGTKVRLFGRKRRKRWYTVKSVHPTRKWIELEELTGNFQRTDVYKFLTNVPI